MVAIAKASFKNRTRQPRRHEHVDVKQVGLLGGGHGEVLSYY
jgi:hypothetical protein